MFKKLDTKILLIVFMAMALILAITQRIKKPGNERNFRDYLARVDTSAVTAVSIIPKGKKEPLVLKKTANQWTLVVNSKNYNADKNAVTAVLKGLSGLKTERVVAGGKEKWEHYEVTENTGTTVKVEENGKVAAVFILGKVSYDQNYQNITTFARMQDEQDVYAIAGFLPMNFNHDIHSLRFRKLGSGSPDKIHRVTFSYPADSSFTLSKSGKYWSVNAQPADSAAVLSYLSSLTSSAGNSFANDIVPSGKPLFSILAEGEGKNVFEIKAYPAHLANLFYVTSSANPGSVFSETRDNLITGLFVSQKHFIKTLKP